MLSLKRALALCASAVVSFGGVSFASDVKVTGVFEGTLAVKIVEDVLSAAVSAPVGSEGKKEDIKEAKKEETGISEKGVHDEKVSEKIEEPEEKTNSEETKNPGVSEMKVGGEAKV